MYLVVTVFDPIIGYNIMVFAYLLNTKFPLTSYSSSIYYLVSFSLCLFVLIP